MTDIENAFPAADEHSDSGTGRSHADKLRQARRERRANGGRRADRLRLAIPPGEVVVVLRPITTKSVTKAVKGKGGIGQHIALLLEHIESVDVLDPETGKIVPASTYTDRPDIPVRVDEQLQEILELRGTTPEQWLVDLYEAEDWPIIKHSIRLDQWSSGEDLDADTVSELEELMDPSSAATRS